MVDDAVPGARDLTPRNLRRECLNFGRNGLRGFANDFYRADDRELSLFVFRKPILRHISDELQRLLGVMEHIPDIEERPRLLIQTRTASANT